MGIVRVVPNITTDRIEESREFYTGLLGFRVAMDMEWIVTLSAPDNPTAQISFVRGPSPEAASAAVTLTVEVEDVDQVHAEAVRRGDTILYPLKDEPWGVRRFHVVDPSGVIVNVMMHIE